MLFGGGCCCSCTDCCGGSSPDEFEVDLNLSNDMCDHCELVTGPFILTRTSPEFCAWTYRSPVNESYNCGDPEPYDLLVHAIRSVYIRLHIACINSTQYRISLEAELVYVNEYETPTMPPCYNPTVVAKWFWSKVVTASGYNCTTALESLPLDLVFCTCGNNGLDCVGAGVLPCTSAGDATIEALA